MKCSDCKYYKMDECKLKPESEFFIAESFDCFELDDNKAALEKQTGAPADLKSTRWDWILHFGGILFWIGVIGIIISVIIFISGLGYLPEPEALGPMLIGGIVFLVSLSTAVVGALWWFVVRVKERHSDVNYNENYRKPRL
jgi:hypothetical protein